MLLSSPPTSNSAWTSEVVEFEAVTSMSAAIPAVLMFVDEVVSLEHPTDKSGVSKEIPVTELIKFPA